MDNTLYELKIGQNVILQFFKPPGRIMKSSNIRYQHSLLDSKSIMVSMREAEKNIHIMGGIHPYLVVLHVGGLYKVLTCQSSILPGTPVRC